MADGMGEIAMKIALKNAENKEAELRNLALERAIEIYSGRSADAAMITAEAGVIHKWLKDGAV